MIVTYYGHSGFSVDTGRHVLLFDYIGGGYRRPDRPSVAFVSHAHSDHWMRGVEQLADSCVAGYDLPPQTGRILLAPGEKAVLTGVEVRAYRSTDTGVSFAVRADGLNLFHAGDLNFWHWRSDGDEEYTRNMERAFHEALQEMDGEAFDAAFFPVDERIGDGYDEGADLFISRLRPRILFPMHWTRPETAAAFAEKHSRDEATRVIALTSPGESAIL